MPTLHYNADLLPNARMLRNNMTAEEKTLFYRFLRKLSIPVKRQKIFDHYILDFYIPKAKIAIELDGRQHLSEEHMASDAKRDAVLKEDGIMVLRYPNRTIHEELQWVCADIENKLEERIPDYKRLYEKI